MFMRDIITDWQSLRIIPIFCNNLEFSPDRKQKMKRELSTSQACSHLEFKHIDTWTILEGIIDACNVSIVT